MENTNIDRNLGIRNKQEDTSKRKEKKIEKGSLVNKKDVDELDINEEYFTNSKVESDGEDF
jgi:hypothetical protein